MRLLVKSDDTNAVLIDGVVNHTDILAEIGRMPDVMILVISAPDEVIEDQNGKQYAWFEGLRRIGTLDGLIIETPRELVDEVERRCPYDIPE